MINLWLQADAVALCKLIGGARRTRSGGGNRRDDTGLPRDPNAVNFHRHIGFTGTRHGMTAAQLSSVATLLQKATIGISMQRLIAHHGICVGADSQFHELCRSLFTIDQMHIVGHPGPDWPHGNLCARVTCDETRPNYAHMKRNQHIVDAADIMIATPAQDVPQWRGGTWATIRMAIRAMEHVDTAIDALYVIGHDGRHMDYAGRKL